jgi:hypothetical protein
VNNYNIHLGCHERKPSMLEYVRTKGVRSIDHKDGPGLDFTSITVATNAIKNTTVSLLETGAPRTRKAQGLAPTMIERRVDAPSPPVSEVTGVLNIEEAIVFERMQEEGNIITSVLLAGNIS